MPTTFVTSTSCWVRKVRMLIVCAMYVGESNRPTTPSPMPPWAWPFCDPGAARGKKGVRKRSQHQEEETKRTREGRD